MVARVFCRVRGEDFLLFCFYAKVSFIKQRFIGTYYVPSVVLGTFASNLNVDQSLL